jgi:endoglucanase
MSTSSNSNQNPDRSLRLRIVVGVAAAALAAAFVPATVSNAATAAPAASRVAARNNLNAGSWAPFTAPWDGPWKAYTHSSGSTKSLVGKIALRPRVYWITSSTQNAQATSTVRQLIDYYQHGDRSKTAQLAVFGMYPKGESRRKEPISAAQQAAYRTWVNRVAAGIGESKVIMVLEPDLAVAWGGWRPGVRFGMAAYAAKVFGALPNTRVYLDGSDADWLKPAKAVQMLRLAGVKFVDGIALGSTHYSGVPTNIRFGANLVRRLAALGVKGKTVVIDTADNGKPFTPRQFKKRFPHGDLGNANLCRTRSETHCVTLGIPPTTDVTNARWHLAASDRRLAAAYVDAYLWFGRPWLYKQASPFKLNRALAVARTTPY